MIIGQLTQVEPGFLHQFALVMVGLLGGAASAAGIYAAVKKRTIEPQPLEIKAADRFALVDMCKVNHRDVARRLEAHDEQIEQIWNTLRAENIAIRHEMTACFKDIERALGRIEGKLEDKAKG